MAYVTYEQYKAGNDLIGANFATKTGKHPDFEAGSAEQLEATVGIVDNAPYLFRLAGGSADIGNRMEDEIVGGTINWNQLVPTNLINLSYTTSAEVESDDYGAMIGNVGTSMIGHKVYCRVVTNETLVRVVFGTNCNDFATGANVAHYTEGMANESIYEATDAIVGNGSIYYRLYAGCPVGAHTFTLQMFDLTAMFGGAIADYLYNIEQTTSGSGIAWFRSYFPDERYFFNAGEPLSVNTIKHITTGFNQWDEQWNAVNGEIESVNYNRVLPSTIYYAYCGKTEVVFTVSYYDINKQQVGSDVSVTAGTTFTVPAGVEFFKFVTTGYGDSYTNDICFNISHSGRRNGEYEQYERHEYELADVELRGIPMLDANHRLYYDGDIYKSDETVTRRYWQVDLSTLDWNIVVSNNRYIHYATVSDIKKSPNGATIPKWYCPPYTPVNVSKTWVDKDMSWRLAENNDEVAIVDNDYKTSPLFKQAMSGVILTYELANPTIETVAPFTNPQVVNDFGTEEYVDERDVPMPVGHRTFYEANLRDKLQSLPDMPNTTGDYMVHYDATTRKCTFVGGAKKMYRHCIYMFFSTPQIYLNFTIISSQSSAMNASSILSYLSSAKPGGYSCKYPVSGYVQLSSSPSNFGIVTTISANSSLIVYSYMKVQDGYLVTGSGSELASGFQIYSSVSEA